MGRVTFQDSEVIRRINRDFSAIWKNVHPGYKVEHLEGARFDEIKQIPNGQASENVVTLFCTADGDLLHVVPGHWKPKDYVKEMDFALSMAQAVARAGADVNARRKVVSEKHRERLALLDRAWDGGVLGRQVIANVHKRMIQEPLRKASEVRGVEDYALTAANNTLAQKVQRLQQAAQNWQRQGKDMRPIGEATQGLEQLIQAGKLGEAEARLDRALGLLGASFAPEDRVLSTSKDAPPHAEVSESLQRKMERASMLAEQWKRDGKDLTPVAKVMNEVEPLMRQGKFKEAERVLERGLQILEGKGTDDAKKAGQLSGRTLIREAVLPGNRAETQDSLRAKIEALKPARVAWRQIQCKSCLLEGLRESREKKKPLMLWVFIDRPAVDARC